jgi:hypothetical protein
LTNLCWIDKKGLKEKRLLFILIKVELEKQL